MNIDIFVMGPVQTNCYIVYDDNKNCIIIDCETNSNGQAQEYFDYVSQNSLSVKAVVLTHGHFDHLGAAKAVSEKYGCPVYIGKLDKEYLENKTGSVPFDRMAFSFFDALEVNDGDILKFGDIELKAIHTPGHSKGSTCYICSDVIFTGDTMFANDCGATDFYGGSWEDMQKSLLKLANLEGDYTILSGHGPITTLDKERKDNPYIPR